MSIRTEYALKLAQHFALGHRGYLPGAIIGEDERSASSMAGFHAVHIRTFLAEASIFRCYGDRREWFVDELTPWHPKIHEAWSRTPSRHDRGTAEDNFKRLNPHAKVFIECRADLVSPKSPFNISCDDELRIVITAKAPMKRKGAPIDIRRKQCVVVVDAATLDGMTGLGQHFFSFFGPDREEIPF